MTNNTKENKLKKIIEYAKEKYFTTPDGRVFNKKNGKELKPYKDKGRYKYISVYIGNGKTKKVNVHRLVAFEHVPNPNPKEKIYINHIDGDKLNNKASNLEWCDMAYNVRDGFKRGRVIWNKGNMSEERAMFLFKKYPKQIFWMLRENNFAMAKAVFGKKPDDISGMAIQSWQHHLMQAVISEDPIEYYYKFITQRK